MFQLTPIVRNLLIVNVVLFLLTNFLPLGLFAYFNPVMPGEANDWFINPYFRPWQPLSYMFLHSGLGHIFSNMFGLVIFGSAIEAYMGSKRFFWYYILTGVGAALFYSGLNYYEATTYLFDSDPYNDLLRTPMVGASGAIFGLLVAFGVLFPNVELMLLFFPFPIKAKYFVVLYGLYEIYAGTNGLETNVAHFAHVGGLIAGFVLLRFGGFDQNRR